MIINNRIDFNSGISLLSLTITIVLMLILSFTVSINIYPYIEEQKMTKFETDILILQENVEQYYAKNNSLPTANVYTSTSILNQNINDNDLYYVIDLDKLEGIKLNYGKDYYEIEDKQETIQNLFDIYIINEQSHIVYYVKGISYKEKIYYTNEPPNINNMSVPVSKPNAVRYTNITQCQTEMLAEKVQQQYQYKKLTTSIPFGLQWDAVCVFIEKCDPNNNASTKSEWLTNMEYNKLWGNFLESTYSMNRGFYNIYENNQGTYQATSWRAASNKTLQTENRLCTTGASDQNCSLNIYDFAGNLWEYTLEKSSSTDFAAVFRGGSFQYTTVPRYASYRVSTSTNHYSYQYTSRVVAILSD